MSEYIFPKKNSFSFWGIAFFKLILVVNIYLLGSGFLSIYIYPIIENISKPQFTSVFTNMFIAERLWRVVYFIGLGTGFGFAKRAVLTERKLRMVEEQHFQKTLDEKELKRIIADTQLAFIKSQVNPHFLYNTLNFFYSNIYPLSKPLAKSLLILSDMMRYALKNQENNGLVELKLELEHIQNYIYLNQLRFNSKLQIIYQVTGDPDQKRIVSFLLITLVENAFKYGDLTDELNPMVIRIDIRMDETSILIRNKKNLLGHKFESSGNGLKLLKGQLNIIYKRNYYFHVEEDNVNYECHLKLNLDND
ncbi:histidine kinase [Mucilaginibacter sp. HC2]|uniref:sensor histidine kinase n=1 Tax=Mucilaginibacter inviolabilis TaxID=2714892 RepID=UPI00140A9617|nr:histidine kinase [Mucilaginibacter inviolabilis]NHA05827.1 histidine kinase [Mucilaginibacter inviolabilis]